MTELQSLTLWTGNIDVIATDHAPHTPRENQTIFNRPPFAYSVALSCSFIQTAKKNQRDLLGSPKKWSPTCICFKIREVEVFFLMRAIMPIWWCLTLMALLRSETVMCTNVAGHLWIMITWKGKNYVYMGKMVNVWDGRNIISAQTQKRLVLIQCIIFCMFDTYISCLIHALWCII